MTALRTLIDRWLQRRSQLPLHGFTASPVPLPLLDSLDDSDLIRLNEALPWRAFIVDSRGRRFGNAASVTKRSQPQPLPDPRIARMDSRFGLEGKGVLEIGCFEGIHTAALCGFGAKVQALDSRIENVAKTLVRCAMLGHSPKVLLHDVESPGVRSVDYTCDLAHHVGVLYHLRDPVSHLLALSAFIREGIMLDTHYALAEQANDSYVAGGQRFSYRRYDEFGRDDVFSGMHDHAKWLLLDDLVALLHRAGFRDVDVAETRSERHGQRALIFASR